MQPFLPSHLDRSAPFRPRTGLMAADSGILEPYEIIDGSDTGLWWGTERFIPGQTENGVTRAARFEIPLPAPLRIESGYVWLVWIGELPPVTDPGRYPVTSVLHVARDARARWDIPQSKFYGPWLGLTPENIATFVLPTPLKPPLPTEQTYYYFTASTAPVRGSENIAWRIVGTPLPS